MKAIAIEVSGQQVATSADRAVASAPRPAEIAKSAPPNADVPPVDIALADDPRLEVPPAADLAFDGQSGPRWETRPDKFALETRIIELGATLSAAQQMFKLLERDFYLATFGRYDE